ncbi:hypothetical protein U1Q18_005654 [Sarracenia purpurea var. burkii]
MDTQIQHEEMRDKIADCDQQSSDKLKPEPPPAAAAAAASPPSATCSPAHEFSFTISLHHPPSAALPDKLAKHTPSIAVDLSPADDIFFHGHLLPLHLLSHLPVSPRSSTNSLDSFTLPIREIIEEHQKNPNKTSTNFAGNNGEGLGRAGERPKSKSFSLFFGLSKWRKGFEVREKEEEIKEKNKRRKIRFDVMSEVLKRYMRMVRPLLSFRLRRRENLQFRRQPYSFSGYLSPRGKKELRGRRGELSAPASMRTSPTNSGLLVSTSGDVPTSTRDSTMEELQAAIQAAIAHCKNSIAMEGKDQMLN